MSDHEMLWNAGPPKDKNKVSRPFWYCSCSRFVGGKGLGWVWYPPQRKAISRDVTKAEAERLFRRHVEDAHEEVY